MMVRRLYLRHGSHHGAKELLPDAFILLQYAGSDRWHGT